MGKSADAFRTISEVADWLETPAHVLRFWESKFSQVKPVKRAGGRRYYRPADMRLLGGIKKLLHDDGMTIKGVQKLLRDQGVKHVSDMAPALDDSLQDTAEAAIALDAVDQTPSDGAQVLDFARSPAKSDPPVKAEPDPDPQDQPREPELFGDPEPETVEPKTPAEQTVPDDATPTPETNGDEDQPETPENTTSPDNLAAQDDQPETPEPPTFKHNNAEDTPSHDDAVAQSEDSLQQAAERPTDTPEAQAPHDAPPPSTPKPDIIELADDAPDTVEAGSGILSKLSELSSPRDSDMAQELEQVAQRLRALIND